MAAGLPERQDEGAAGSPAPRPTISFFLGGLFVIALAGALHVARVVFMPVALAVLLALTLAPAVRVLRRWHIPNAAGAAIVLLFVLGLFSLAGFGLSGPVSVWVQRAPEVAQRVTEKFERVAQPLKQFVSRGHSGAGGTPEPAPKAEAKTASIIQSVAAPLAAGVSLGGTTFVLLYFLLAAGDPLLSAVLNGIRDATRRERALAIGHEIKQHISKYLLAISLINLAEGGLIAGGLAIAGMPTPLLWGALHALLNFIPYLGAITGLVLTALVALVSFDSISRALIAPAIYLGVMILDNFASPLVLGKRLVLNPVLVFLSLMFWGWLWGIIGIVIAVPLLIALKIMCDHVPAWQRYGRIISAEEAPRLLEPGGAKGTVA